MRKTIFLVLVLMFGFSLVIFVSNHKTKTKISFIKPQALLYENEDATEPNGHYVSPDFATPSSNSNNINVYFNNKGTSSVTVTLQKKGLLGGWSDVDYFTAAAGKDSYKEMPSASKTTYRIKVDAQRGDAIKGHLKANQL